MPPGFGRVAEMADAKDLAACRNTHVFEMRTLLLLANSHAFRAKAVYFNRLLGSFGVILAGSTSVAPTKFPEGTRQWCVAGASGGYTLRTRMCQCRAKSGTRDDSNRSSPEDSGAFGTGGTPRGGPGERPVMFCAEARNRADVHLKGAGIGGTPGDA